MSVLRYSHFQFKSGIVGTIEALFSLIHMEDSWSTVLRDDMGRPCVVLCAVWVVLMG